MKYLFGEINVCLPFTLFLINISLGYAEGGLYVNSNFGIFFPVFMSVHKKHIPTKNMIVEQIA